MKCERPATSLIVTGDDFGASRAVNAAVVQAYREGILTSASLMANGAAFPEAVTLARENPGLAVGIHVSLLRGKGVLPHEAAPRLLDRDGRLPENPVLAGFRYFFDPAVRRELEREVEAQIRKVIDAGIRPSHLDGHLHLHVHPAVLPIVVKLASKHGIRAFRLPRESLRISLKADKGGLGSKLLHGGIYKLLCGRAEKRLRAHGLVYADHFFGLLASGHVTEGYLLRLLDELPAGVVELGTHPAHGVPPELEAWAPEYQYDAELQALTSARVRRKLKEASIRLTNYDECSRSSSPHGVRPSSRL